uniref:Uncharacterized protein n=1 Tax=Amphimedon queenslandica TaxID=400682 RepID=A0A1X7TU05_AMPQE
MNISHALQSSDEAVNVKGETLPEEHMCTKLKLLLAMSFALLPIPAEAVDKVERGVLIDFKDLLHNNVTLFDTLQELGSSAPTSVQQMRDITDSLSRAYCFLSFVAVSVHDRDQGFNGIWQGHGKKSLRFRLGRL